jgi:uncharacterized protein YukE
MGTIHIDYTKVYQEVERLRMVAIDCQKLHDDSRKAFSDINNYWEGEACAAFLSANDMWRREILYINQEIQSISSAIKRVADEIHAAELRAISSTNSISTTTVRSTK